MGYIPSPMAQVLSLPSCPFCGSASAALYTRKKGKDIFRCGICAGGFVHPVPTIGECKRFYDSEYGNGRYCHRLGQEAQALKERTFLSRWEALRRYFPSAGRILDVGCSSGAFLKVMEDEGWDVYGIDISRESSREAREKWGEKISVMSLEEPSFPPPPPLPLFDLVTLFDVLEHSPEPRALLKGVRSLLRPGGLLAVTTHNFSSPVRKLMGRLWSYLDPLEHLSYFSPVALKALLGASGFSITELRASGKFVSVDFLLGESEFSNPIFFRISSPVIRALLPANLLHRPFYLHFGEIMAIAV